MNKSILLMSFVCLMGCVSPAIVPSSVNSFEVVCYNSSTDCMIDAGNACGAAGFRILGSPEVRTEGRAGDDSASLRVTYRVICNPTK